MEACSTCGIQFNRISWYVIQVVSNSFRYWAVSSNLLTLPWHCTTWFTGSWLMKVVIHMEVMFHAQTNRGAWDLWMEKAPTLASSICCNSLADTRLVFLCTGLKQFSVFVRGLIGFKKPTRCKIVLAYICFAHGMHMDSVSTTSRLNDFNNWYAFSFFPFIITRCVVLALAALHKLQAVQRPWWHFWRGILLFYQWKDLSLTPASPVQCCVYKFYNYSSCALSSSTGYGIRDVNFS